MITAKHCDRLVDIWSERLNTAKHVGGLQRFVEGVFSTTDRVDGL